MKQYRFRHTLLKYVAVLLAAFALSLQACKKDYLERSPTNLISKDEVFGTLDNAEGFLNNAYGALPDIFKPGGDNNWMLSSGSDEGEQIWDIGIDANVFNNGSASPSSFPLSDYWSQYYQAIRRINLFLANYDVIPEPKQGDDPNRKKRLKGEAYTLRAYYYFELYKMWGSVPLVAIPLATDNLQEYMSKGRAPVEDIMNFIKGDIEAALPLLSTNNYEAGNNRAGRIDGVAAKAILSRALLYFASPLSNPNNDASRWQAAATASKDALDFALANNRPLQTQGHDGYPAYQGVFVNNANNKVKEIIWGRAPEDGNWWETVTQSNRVASGLGGWYGTAPSVELLESYEMVNGATYDPQHPFANRDPRATQTIAGHGESWRGNVVDVRQTEDGAPVGPDYKTDHPVVNLFLKKFMNSGTSYPARTWILYRTGELYLNYAEAQNEAAGPDASVYAAVNAIRNRAGMPDLPAGLSKDQMRERIRNERRVELSFEEHRFWDVRRWKIAETEESKPLHKMMVVGTAVNNVNITYPILEQRVFLPKHYLFPIPQSEVDKNPELGQNPGW